MRFLAKAGCFVELERLSSDDALFGHFPRVSAKLS